MCKYIIKLFNIQLIINIITQILTFLIVDTTTPSNSKVILYSLISKKLNTTIQYYSF